MTKMKVTMKMSSQDYLKESARTVSENYGQISKRMISKEMIDLQHAAIGIATESGEFLDALKKHIWYGKALDRVNLKEELGDLLWYIAYAMRTLETDFGTEMQRNIDKLVLRFPDKFTELHAEYRDLVAERVLLARDEKEG